LYAFAMSRVSFMSVLDLDSVNVERSAYRKSRSETTGHSREIREKRPQNSIRQRKHQGEVRAAVRSGVDLNMTTVCFNEGLGNKEPQPRAFSLATRRPAMIFFKE